MTNKLAKKQKIIDILVTLGINSVFFWICCYFNTPIFSTNDDYRMKLLASGAYTGDPESYLVFIRWPIGSMLALGYTYLEQVNWYGIFVMASYFAPCCILLYKVLSSFEVHAKKMTGLIVYIIFLMLVVRNHLLMPQFTTMAGFWGMAGIVLWHHFLYGKEESERRGAYVFFLFCVLMSLAVRKKVLFLFLPVYVLIVLNYLEAHREQLKKVAVSFVACIIAIMVVLCVNSCLYSGEGYEEYEAFNEARSMIYDYSGVPTYTENQEFYDSIGVDVNVYNAIKGRTFDVDDAINAQNLERIYDYAIEKQDKTFSLTSMAQDITMIAEFLMQEDIRAQIFGICIYLLLLFWAIQAGMKVTNSWAPYFVVLYAVAVLFWLGYGGRIVQRVVEVLFLQITVCLLLDLLEYIRQVDKNIVQEKSFSIFVCTGMAVVFFVTGINSFNVTNRLYGSLKEYADYLVDLRAYAQEEDVYIFYHARNFIASSGYVLEDNDTSFCQIDSLGNWNAMSLTWKKRNEKIGATSAIDGMENNEKICYAELGVEEHSVIGGILRKDGKTLKLREIIASGSREIAIYDIVKGE